MEQMNELSALTFKESGVKKERETKIEFPTIRVILPKEVASKVQSTLHLLKERKADVKIEELLSEFLSGLSNEYLDAQVQKLTPDDYYFEMARSIPELKVQLIQKAKRIINARVRGEPLQFIQKVRRKRKPKKSPDSDNHDIGPAKDSPTVRM